MSVLLLLPRTKDPILLAFNSFDPPSSGVWMESSVEWIGLEWSGVEELDTVLQQQQQLQEGCLCCWVVIANGK